MPERIKNIPVITNNMKIRSFISVDIEATDDIRTFINEIVETGANINMVNPDMIHVTIKFLGDIDEEMVADIGQKLDLIVEGRKPFVIDLKGVGTFPSIDYMKVIWIGIEENTELSDIAHRVEEELVPLGFSREKRSFSPHITVGRVKSGRNKQRLRAVVDDYRDVDFGKIIVNKLNLKKSVLKPDGPEYTTLKEFYLL